MKFSKTLKIEMVVPNRLKISVETDAKVLTANKDDLFKLSSTWLHGAIASNLEVKVSVLLTPVKTKFKIFKDYIFDDFTRTNRSSKEEVFSDKLDKDGKADFNFSFEGKEKPSGMLKATFETKVFEEGGDFSVDTFSLPYSRYENYVGIKMPKGGASRGILLTDKKQTIKIVSLDENGKEVSLKNIEVKIYKISWRWWWAKTKESLARYSQSKSIRAIREGKTSTKKGIGTFDFEIKYPEWGRYLVRACDTKGGHCSSKIFYADWPGWAGRARKDSGSGATRLNFTTDKKKYIVGETATLFLPVTTDGRALISVENGSKVLSQQWASLKKGENKLNIAITKEMTPNVYFNVTLVQAHKDKKNDSPIRLYGVMPVLVEDPNTNLHPILSVPEVVKPLGDLEIKVSEKNKKKMTYTIAVVDEGLLSLTRFKTPNLKKEFYKKEGLGVKTWDLFDFVIGAYGINLEKIISIGGSDDDGDNRARSKKKRFIPVVKYIGPFYLKAGQTKTHKIKMPKYVGAVRVMLVAGNSVGLNNAYGSDHKEVKVKSDLMVLGSLPRTLKPGDELMLPVTVFSMNPEIKKVDVKLVIDGKIEILSSSKGASTGALPVLFKEGETEKMAFFKIKVNAIGKAYVKIEASSGKFKASYDFYIDVKAPNNLATIVEKIVIEPNKSFEKKMFPFGIKNSNKLILEVSTVPPLNLEKRLQYLIKYPHGCIEQTTSSVFPQLYLNALVKLEEVQKNKIEENIKSGIEKIQKFQNSEGGFTYWPGRGDKADQWGTNYAFNFLLEAEKLGYLVPADLKHKAREYQNTMAVTWVDSKNKLIQSYRLYTLALAKKPNIGAMNRLKELKSLDYTSKWLLASTYYMIGQKDIALEMVKGLSFSINDYNESSNTYGSTLRDEAIILNAMNIINYDKSNELLKKIASKISTKNWYSTQTTAYSLMSLSKFYNTKGTKGFNFDIMIDKKNAKVKSNKLIYQKEIKKFLKEGRTIKINNANSHPIFLSIINKGIPASGEEKEYSNDIKLSAKYPSVKIKELKQGDDFKLLLTIKNLKRKKLENIAITYIVPSGVQINRTQISEGIKIDFRDIRDDRVYYYLSLKPNESKTFELSLNASYTGKYYLSAISASAMYDNTIGALLKGKWVEVIK